MWIFPYIFFAFINIYIIYELINLTFKIDPTDLTFAEWIRYITYFLGMLALVFIDKLAIYLLWNILMLLWILYGYSLDRNQVLPIYAILIGFILGTEFLPLLVFRKIGLITQASIFEPNIYLVFFIQSILKFVLLLLYQTHTKNLKSLKKAPLFVYALAVLFVLLHGLVLIQTLIPQEASVYFVRDDLFIASFTAISLLLGLTIINRLQSLYQDHLRLSAEAYEHKLYQGRLNELEKHQQQIRSLEHDFRKHLGILQRYANHNDLKGIQEYLRSSQEIFPFPSKTGTTGHLVIDTLVKDLEKKSKDAKINLKIEIKGESFSGIEDFDLTTVLSNIMDNAFDATASLPETHRWIHLHIECQKGIFWIECVNPYDNQQDGSIQKGIGLANVERAVEKYKGLVNITTDDSIFKIQCLMYQDD